MSANMQPWDNPESFRFDALPAGEIRSQDLSSLSDDQLKRELADGLLLTVRGLHYCAARIRELERRGVDLSHLRLGMMRYLRRIAFGQLAAELVIRFAEKPRLLELASSLPMPDQMHLAAGKPVLLVEFAPDGSLTHRMADPLHLTKDQVRQVFGQGHIHPEAEQALLLTDRRTKAVRKSRPEVETRGQAKIDRVAKVVRIGRYTFSFDEWRTIGRILGD